MRIAVLFLFAGSLGAQPVVVRVDTAKRLGAAGADLGVLRLRRAELHLHEGRQEAAVRNCGAQPGAGLRARAQPAGDRATARPALKWGSTNAYTEDAAGKPVYDWTIVDRIFDTYMERKMKPLVQIGFMPEALSSHPRALPAPLEAGRQLQRHLHRLGLSAEGLQQVGRAGVPVGAALRRRSTAAPKWNRGCGRCGTSRTSAIGRARRRSTTSSTTTRPTR